MGGTEKRVDAGWWPEEPYSVYLPLGMVHGPSGWDAVVTVSIPRGPDSSLTRESPFHLLTMSPKKEDAARLPEWLSQSGARSLGNSFHLSAYPFLLSLQ